MAQGVNNNAAAVGRSGDSKAADAEATRVMLEAIGGYVRETIEQLYNMLSESRRDELVWSVNGLTGYSIVDVDGMLTAVSKAIDVGIPSETWGKEVRKRVALMLVPEADQPTRDAIVAEIEENYHQADDASDVYANPLDRDLADDEIGDAAHADQ
jgi:hypothetical protein